VRLKRNPAGFDYDLGIEDIVSKRRVEGKTRVCGDCGTNGNYMGCRSVVCLFPADYDPQVLTRLVVDVPRRRNHLC
jgi:hypothetical protein